MIMATNKVQKALLIMYNGLYNVAVLLVIRIGTRLTGETLSLTYFIPKSKRNIFIILIINQTMTLEFNAERKQLNNC